MGFVIVHSSWVTSTARPLSKNNITCCSKLWITLKVMALLGGYTVCLDTDVENVKLPCSAETRLTTDSNTLRRLTASRRPMVRPRAGHSPPGILKHDITISLTQLYSSSYLSVWINKQLFTQIFLVFTYPFKEMDMSNASRLKLVLIVKLSGYKILQNWSFCKLGKNVLL